MTLGERIKEARKINRMTQEKLAELLDVSRVTISSWENGENLPTADNIAALSRAFFVTTDYLINGVSKQNDTFPTRVASPTQDDIFLSLFQSLGPVERDEVIKFMRYQKYLSEAKK